MALTDDEGFEEMIVTEVVRINLMTLNLKRYEFGRHGGLQSTDADVMAADAGSRDPDSDGDAVLQLIKFGLHSIYHILIQSLHIFVVSANTNTNNPFSYFLYLDNCYKAAAV